MKISYLVNINSKFWAAFLIIILTSFTSYSQTETLRINEFLALNQTGIMDKDSVYSDWIEIYNSTATPINLQGWTLTDNIAIPRQWEFPDITIGADSYIIVFASGKDRSVAGEELHTNFKLSGSGEYLGLFNPSATGVTVFEPTFPAQQTDVSYGFLENGYILFSDPTPGKDNALSSTIQVPAPQLSVKHGFFDAPFTLKLTNQAPEAKIYYTMDGSVPSSVNGAIYSAPIAISKTTVIRAIAENSVAKPSKVSTATYIFVDDVINQPNNPLGYPAEWGPYCQIPGTAIADYEMDPELISNPTIANNVKLALKDLPTISLVTDKNNFFSKSTDSVTGGIYIYTGTPVGNNIGLDWERPVSFEYFDAKDSISLQVDCGVQLHGGHSRLPEKSPKHSIRVEFKSEYGPANLKFPFFGEDGADEFNSITFIAGFGNTWVHHSSDERVRAQFSRNAWAKNTQLKMGNLATRTSFAHLFINGLYWGVYGPSERIDSDFAASYLEGKAEDFDVIKDYSEVVNGTIDAWNTMMTLARSGMAIDANYQRIQGNNPDGTPNPAYPALLDVENLIDYMLINMYGGNTDWDHHNWAAIRNRLKPGKGFQFICWDSEHVLKTVNENVVNENNSDRPSELFQLLKQNEEFCRLVADRAQKHCFNNGLLSPEKSADTWINLEKEVDLSIDAESARWGDYRRDVHPYQTAGPFALYTKENQYLTQQNFLLNTYFPQRTAAFINQLKNADLFPVVGAPSFYINGQPAVNETIENSDILSMTATQGTIYYTLDGSDPVVWESSQEINEVVLIQDSSPKKVLVPTSDIGNTWKSDLAFNDASWLICSGTPGGIGYETESGYDSYITLDIETQLFNKNTSCYVRIPFSVSSADISGKTVMSLNVNYDDGFVAYLNGVKIAEKNAPAALVWNSASTLGHEANNVEQFDVSVNLQNLIAGDNILAIHALNQNLTSSDFIINTGLKLSNVPLAGGSISASAVSYSGPVEINHSVRVNARTFYNGEWSALNDKFLIIPEDYEKIKITEINYNPEPDEYGDNSKYEFIEIKNTGSGLLDIGNMSFVEGIEFKFPIETEFQAGSFIVLASDDDSFYERYGFRPFDDYKGQLDNNGEWIKVATAMNDTICKFEFNDGVSWTQTPDGEGNSLVPTEYNPTNNQNSPFYWRASYAIGGSPGKDDLPTGLDNSIEQTVQSFVLSQNYPNPFIDKTYIDYQLPEDATVNLTVYDLMGRAITTLAAGFKTAGLYQVEWNAFDESAGVFICRLTIITGKGHTVFTQKMLKLK